MTGWQHGTDHAEGTPSGLNHGMEGAMMKAIAHSVQATIAAECGEEIGKTFPGQRRYGRSPVLRRKGSVWLLTPGNQIIFFRSFKSPEWERQRNCQGASWLPHSMHLFLQLICRRKTWTSVLWGLDRFYIQYSSSTGTCETLLQFFWNALVSGLENRSKRRWFWCEDTMKKYAFPFHPESEF